ncbi:MAG: DUF927 domain-containing protein [Planctomycetota bacterium]
MKNWAQQLVDGLNSYTEVSPSNTGVKVFLRARLPGERRRKGQIEMYDQGRFFTVTSRHLKGTPNTIEDRQDIVTAIHAEIFSEGERPASNPQGSACADDEQLIEHAKRGVRGKKFRALWLGNFNGYQSQSEAELAFCSMLAAYAGNDAERIDRLFRRSGLYRKKWDRQDYSKRTIAKAIESAGKGRAQSAESLKGHAPYRFAEMGIIWDKATQHGVVETRLTNFTARIVADISRDDGAETSRFLELECVLDKQVQRFTVSASQFRGLNWILERLGARAIVGVGQAVRDHIVAAIQHLSQDFTKRTEYSHTGWRKVGDDWMYLHVGGAIGRVGQVAASGGPLFKVVLPEGLSGFVLPDPPDGNETIQSIRAALQFLSVAPQHVTFPLFAAVWRSVLGDCRVTVHLAGSTGVFKTALAALCQQFFGAGLDASQLPASWSSTANALEATAFTLKDALVVLDDFAPGGISHDVARSHKEADRLIRARGNNAGRGRMRSDTTLRPAKPPRCLILSTGEDIPHGQSLRARMLVIEISPGEVNVETLTKCQVDATSGSYSRAMSAFIRCLAGQHDEIQKRRSKEVAELRTRATNGDQHRRLPEAVAELFFGLKVFLEFAVDFGAVASSEQSDLEASAWKALLVTAKAQTAHQTASDPVRRFRELLSSAIGSGRAYIANSTGCEPNPPEAWGWRLTSESDAYPNQRWKPLGDCIDWVEGEELYLDPDVAYQAAQKMAGAEALSVGPTTLWKRLHERGLLASTEIEQGRGLKVRRTIQGKRHEVLHLLKQTLSPPQGPDQPDHDQSKQKEKG